MRNLRFGCLFIKRCSEKGFVGLALVPCPGARKESKIYRRIGLVSLSRMGTEYLLSLEKTIITIV